MYTFLHLLRLNRKVHFFLYIPRVLFLRIYYVSYVIAGGENSWQRFSRQFQVSMCSSLD